MSGIETFSLHFLDYCTFGAYFVVLCIIGFWAGKREQNNSDDYFLAGHTLPWYVVGTSFIASNISTEHFIGMIGAAFIYGMCISTMCWLNISTFSMLIWLFIPFLLAAKIFTTPEFLEKRFNPTLRQFFAIVTVISNVTAFLAAVLYGGGLALQKLFGWNLWFSIIALGVVAGSWAIYGGLKSVAWTDFYTVIIMVVGGIMVTILGLYMLSGESHSLIQGWRVMIERNMAKDGIWVEVMTLHSQNMAKVDTYNRLSVFQPATHAIVPWPNMILGMFSVGLWYSCINQFMIQRVLGARNMYHARMGIVLAGYMQIILPLIIVIPGLILFARYPEVLNQPWDKVRPEADKGYVHMLQTLIPIGFRGLFLAALFGAIQSTINSVLNSTATIVTLDIYKRMLRPKATEKHTVRIGIWVSVVILVISIVGAGFIPKLGGSLFVYIQSLYAFFAPPFAAVFLLGILFKRINKQGAVIAVFSGFLLGILIKVYIHSDLNHPGWLEPFAMQSIVNWVFCVIVCVIVSLMTSPPAPEQVTDKLTFNWKKLNIFGGLGTIWYTNVVLWWGVFVLIVVLLLAVFSGLVFN